MSDGGPLSVPLPRDLRDRLEAWAAQRQLKVATAARALIAEKLADLDADADLARAQTWQREQAWATWEAAQRPGARRLSLAEVLAPAPAPRRRKPAR